MFGVEQKRRSVFKSAELVREPVCCCSQFGLSRAVVAAVTVQRARLDRPVSDKLMSSKKTRSTVKTGRTEDIIKAALNKMLHTMQKEKTSVLCQLSEDAKALRGSVTPRLD